MRVSVYILLVLCACSSSGSRSSPDAQGSGSACGACTADQICSGGACVDLPSQCPCPAGAYCDLANDRCHAGCASDDGCTAANTHCDLAAHSCTCDDETLACGGGCAACHQDEHATAFGCSGDACVITACASGYTPCGNACVDTKSDEANCGACGTSCNAWGATKGVTPDEARCVASQCVATISDTTARSCHDACAARSLTCGPQYAWWSCGGYSGAGCGLYVTTSGSGCPEYDNHVLATCDEHPPSSTTCYFSNATDTGYIYAVDCVCR